MSIISMIVLAFIYLYFIFQLGNIQKGKLKNVIISILISICTVCTGIFSLEYLGAIFVTVLLVLFDLFYDDKSFFKQWKWIVIFGGVTSGIFLLDKVTNNIGKIFLVIEIIFVMHMLLSCYRRLLKGISNIILTIIYCCYLYLAYSFEGTVYSYIILILTISTLLAFETMLSGYNATFKRKTSEFQQYLLANQYEEIKTVYLNMRGFRHDYHNHIQVIKAHMSMNRLEQVNEYLLQLERELKYIDSSIRSGNLMLDAILNSKIAVAEKYNINVTCKADVPEVLHITDIDLCVILGNLLDNAIESCQKISEKPFIRIYITIIKKQLYISIQNAAKEELTFNEKNYISTKRGNHGLGMKRVQLLVNRYEGYLNLQNEPGIFAVEVIFPI